jgi:hypothetical protein
VPHDRRLAVGPIETAGLRDIIDGVHHVFVCFEGFVEFTCRKQCLAPSLVCGQQQGLEIPAEELDKALGYGKHYVCIILTHHSQVLVRLMHEF